MKGLETLSEFLTEGLAEQALAPDKVIQTGFSLIDEYAPLIEGQNTVITARTGRGKTLLGVNLVNGILTHSEASIAVFSVELRKVEFFQRLAACHFDLPLDDFKRGVWDEEQFKTRLADLRGFIAAYRKRLFICDDLHEISQIETKLNELTRKHNVPIQYVLIDYANILSVAHPKDPNKHVDISAWAKFLAKERGYHVQLICQANRLTTEKEDGFARPENLADSDQYGRDAFVVYSVQCKKGGRQALICPTKNRNGETDLVFRHDWNPQSGNLSGAGKLISVSETPKNKQKKAAPTGQYKI